MTIYTYSIRADHLMHNGNHRGHDSVASALDALRQVMTDSDDLVTVKGEDGERYVYRSQEDADADDTGVCAVAIIERDEVEVSVYPADCADGNLRWHVCAGDAYTGRGVAAKARDEEVSAYRHGGAYDDIEWEYLGRDDEQGGHVWVEVTND